jgi:arylsulfatase A-like enzyme
MNRREFFKSAAGLGGASLLEPISAAAKKPNIVLMMADDMGFSDLGCYGSEIQTPNLDRLAARGIRFTQFYNTARCCPTRASLLTGLYPHQAGIGHMVENRGFPGYQGHLNDRCVTIAEALREGGYTTLMSGKWHVGQQRPHWPTDRGFDRYFGLISGGSNYFRLDKGSYMAADDQPYTPPEQGFYMTDAFTDHATDFIGKYGRGEKPFFLYLAFTAPHWPLHAHAEDIAKYRGRYKAGWDTLRQERHRRLIQMGLVDKQWKLPPRAWQSPRYDMVAADHDNADLRMAVYAAQIDRMDQCAGRVMRKLEEIGAEENTLVIFLADNGGCAEVVDRGTPGVPAGHPDSYMSYGLPWAQASNTPFRLYKHWVHEGGIATPFIAHWPAGIRQRGTITNEPGHLVDVMATCLDVGQTRYPKTYRGREVTPLEGRSLRPIFETGRREPHDALFWEHEGNRAVRQGRWKLVSRHPGGWELYDLEADRTEMNNLGEIHPERVREMAGLYRRWAERVGVEPWEKVQAQIGR